MNRLIPLKLVDKDMYKILSDNTVLKDKIIPYEEAIKLLENPDLKDDLYVSNGAWSFGPLVLWNGFNMVDLQILGTIEKRWHQTKQNKDIKRNIVPSNLLVTLLECIDLNILSKEDLEYMVTNTRRMMEYGFEEFDKNFTLKYLKEIGGSDQEITIYRGEDSKSTKIENALSWTESLDTAKFFANRFNKEQGKVYELKINKSDALWIYDNSEQEVLYKIKESDNIKIIEWGN